MGKILVLFVFICYLSFIESKTFVNNESGQSNKQVTESAKFKMIQALMDKQKAAKSVGDYDEILDTTTTEIETETLQPPNPDQGIGSICIATLCGGK